MNGFSNQIGVTTEERITNAFNVGSNVSTRNVGLLVERVRGVAGKPILTNNPTEDKKIFGGHDPNMYSSFVVENLFRNAGGYQANVYQVRVVGEGSTAASVIINSSGAAPALEVIAGNQGLPDVGTWGNDLRVRYFPIDAEGGSAEGILLEVLYKGIKVERFLSTGDSVQDLVNQVNSRSGYITIDVIDGALAMGATMVEAILVGGTYVAPALADYTPAYDEVTGAPIGMAIFDSVDVQVVAAPEVFDLTFNVAARDFAETNNKFFIFNAPFLATETTLETYYNSLVEGKQSYVAGYLNWVEVPRDASGNKIWIPAIGYVLGAGYIRKAGLNNGYVWIPPAGEETAAKGVFRVSHDDLSQDKMSRFVKKWRMNVIKYIANVGYAIYSSRTYSSDPLFESIHVRLQTNWLITNLKARNERFIQKLSNPTIDKSMEIDNTIFMKNVYEQGGIEASIPFNEAVVVNVITSVENRKEKELAVSWIPSECIEHVHVTLSRNDGVLVLNLLNS